VSYFVQFFGILSILVALFSIYLSLTKYRKMLVGKITIFILIQTIVIFLAFTKTQTFGLHHYYMLTPIFLWSLFVVLKFFLDKKGPTRYLYLIVIICISTSALVSFTGAKTNPHVITKSIFGATKELSPIVRGDITELNNITTYLESVMSPGEYVYVLSSSHTFNDDILRNTRLPNSLTINVSGAAHVDKRDGFPNYFFDAEYVAVASPVQTHLEQGSQDVVKYPAQLILSGAAKNLQKLQSFSLDKGIIVTVYKKKHSYDTSFVKNIHDHFKQKYPEYPQLNNIHSLEEQY
jgi:uncharacterized protein YbcV (DUF1398 family)